MSASMLCHGRSVGFHDLLLLFAYQSLVRCFSFYMTNPSTEMMTESPLFPFSIKDNPNRYFSSTATHTLRVDPVIDVFASHSKSKSSPINQLLSIDVSGFFLRLELAANS